MTVETNPTPGMVYSPVPMEGRAETPGIEELEEKVGELERLADSLGTAPEEELVAALDRAVGLLREVNEGIEARIETLGGESRELDGLLGRVDFGAFDAALGELEERSPGED